jgi:hypothetical protein
MATDAKDAPATTEPATDKIVAPAAPSSTSPEMSPPHVTGGEIVLEADVSLSREAQ